MLYKTKLQHAYDRWDQSSELMYTHKFQKAGMSIFDDAKPYVKNSSVHSHECFENEFLDFPSLKITIYSP